MEFCKPLKGFGRVKASFEVTWQRHEKDKSNIYFAWWIHALAWHYQIFEKLPKECHGGCKNACSLLKEEVVQTVSRTWLTE